MARKNGSGIDFPWGLIVFLLLAVWAASLAVPEPKVVFHEGSRRISENLLVGIPVLCALALFTAFLVRRWQTRDVRKLERLRAARLRAEQKQRTNELKRQLAELKRQSAESARKAKSEKTELRKQEAQRRKQETREAIEHEKLLREERLHSDGSG